MKSEDYDPIARALEHHDIWFRYQPNVNKTRPWLVVTSTGMHQWSTKETWAYCQGLADKEKKTTGRSYIHQYAEPLGNGRAIMRVDIVFDDELVASYNEGSPAPIETVRRYERKTALGPKGGEK